MRWLLLAVLLGGAIALGSTGGGTAGAHALLQRSDPPVNSQLRDPPSQITLYFSEPLEQQYSRASAKDQDGKEVDTGYDFLADDDAAMRLNLSPLQPGYITVEWATVSKVDGHRITGSFPITILNQDGSLPAGQPPTSSGSTSGDKPEVLRVIDKWVLLLAGSVLVGALGFMAYVSPAEAAGESSSPRFQRWLFRVTVIALVVAVIAGAADLLLQAHDISTSVSNTIDTQWGQRWLYRHLLLIPFVLLLAGIGGGLANRRALALLALAVFAGYMVLSSSASHAGAGGGSFWAIASDAAHLIASSVWIGMLFVLALLFVWSRRYLETGQRYPVLAHALQRFSVVAMLSVALLLFTGTINGVIELGRIGDFLDTGYGQALGLKLLLLLPLLFIAGYNAYLLRPDFAEAVNPQTQVRDRGAILQDLERQLYKRIRIELVIAVAVLAVVAVLVQLTPTRGRLIAPDQGPGKFVDTADLGDIQATLSIDPNQPGFNTFEVYLAGAVQDVESVRLEFTEATGTTSESRLVLDASNPPTFYLGQGPFLASAGTWNIVINIRRSTGNDLRPSFAVKVEDTTPVATGSRTGGSFASPIDFTARTTILLFASGAFCLMVIAGSVRRPGMPEGYLGWLAAEIAYRAPTNVRPIWTLGALVAIGIALGLLLGSHLHPALSPQEASKDNPIPATDASIARGAMLFQNNCTICHGESGRGDGPAAASLPLQPANLYQHIPYHPDQFFFGVISKGLGGVMPAFEGQISEEDRWNILNYLRATFTTDPAAK